MFSRRIGQELMKVVRVRFNDAISYGLLDGDQVHLIEGEPFGRDLGRVAGAASRRVNWSDCELLVPITPTKVLGVGGNYAAHAAEVGLTASTVPPIFAKPLQTLLPHEGLVVLPPTEVSNRIEHEGEIAVVIGASARNVAREDAAAYIFGITCANDVTARDLQRSDPEIIRAKGFDTFCPIGPYIETEADLEKSLQLTCTVNGELRQRGDTRDFTYDIPTLIAFVSSWTTLVPGDVILTGSPAGTGSLRPGDEVVVAIEGVCELRHSVVAAAQNN